MTNVWNSLTFHDETEATSFNDTVGGGNYLGVGKHPNVLAQDVERVVSKKGNPQLLFTWANDDGATTRDYVPIMGTDKEGNQVTHFVFRMRMSAIIPDRETRAEFLKAAFKNTELFEGLKGSRADLKIKPGAEGYDIREDSLGGYFIFDVSDDSKVSDESFDSFTDAKSHAEDVLDMKRAYPQIDLVSKASGEGSIDANLVGIQALIEQSKVAVAKPKARAGSRL